MDAEASETFYQPKQDKDRPNRTPNHALLKADPDDPSLPILEHAGLLEDVENCPRYLLRNPRQTLPPHSKISCCFCGVGDSGEFVANREAQKESIPAGPGTITLRIRGRHVRLKVKSNSNGQVQIQTPYALVRPGGVLVGRLEVGGKRLRYSGRAIDSGPARGTGPGIQSFEGYSAKVKVTSFKIKGTLPTSGCVKLRLSTNHQKAAYPIHTAPTLLDRATGNRRVITYQEAILHLAGLLLRHRAPKRRTLVYASGQIDYFSIFAMQEVFRLLGIRNLTGNAEHCLNAGAVHNEVLTGQEGPFMTIDQGIKGPDRVYLMNGWNGKITHPPVYNSIRKRKDFDGFLIDVMVTETAQDVAKKLSPDNVLLIRPRSDSQLALAVAHQIFTNHSEAIEKRFLSQFSDLESFKNFQRLALHPSFAPNRVAERIAPEPKYVERLLKGIRKLAMKLIAPHSVPVVIPSVGLSQSSGIVAHCLWGNVLAMLGKYGLKPDSSPAGGVLRVPGQINAESEVQALSRKYFVGRIRMDNAGDAAARMHLPTDAYQRVIEDAPRAALDYAQPTPDEKELFVCMGTQFESNMPNRRRWLEKLTDPNNSLVVIDPIPDPWTLRHADLIIPSPPHTATTKLYQNGEWKLTLSVPQKKPSKETRSDATILYDAMAYITHRLQESETLRELHPDLAKHLDSGYLQQRFCDPKQPGGPGLLRVQGEVSRPQLWDRIQTYLHGGCGPLYCAFDHADGRPILWKELLEKGSIVYGGVGEHRYKLDYDDPDCVPYKDIFQRPGSFKFFTPTEADLAIPDGIIFNSGRSSMSNEKDRMRFATSTFNSGKATPVLKMPDENPLYVSPELANTHALETGDWVEVHGTQSEQSIELPVVVTDRMKGKTVYVSFHRSKAQDVRSFYVNDVTNDVERCPYSGQSQLKLPRVTLKRLSRSDAKSSPTDQASSQGRIDMTTLNTAKKIPLWDGEDTPLYVTDIFQETHDVYTYRFQGNPLCRFAYNPGQFCSVILNIDGKKVIRSYSISSTPTRPYILELTIKRVPGGLVSNWMPDNLKIGDEIHIKGPRGKFCMKPGEIPPKVLLIGAGSGVTPVMSMARWLCDISADVDVLFYCSVRSPQDIVFGSEIQMMTERYRQFQPVIISSTREKGIWTGLTGRIDKKMMELIAPDINERHIYMCGPGGFMDAVKGILGEMDFPIAQLHSESFSGARVKKPKDPNAIAGSMTVEFAKSGQTVQTDGTVSFLELAEENGIDLDYGCRAGSCGDCRLKVLSGDTDAETDEGLSEEEIASGHVLSCVATPKGNCVVDG